MVEAKRDGQLPVTAAVNLAIEPFFSVVGGKGGHVLNITDFDPENGIVSVDNQWGAQNDRTLNIDTLWLTMQDSRAAAKLIENDVNDDRAKGIINADKELDLLRVKMSSRILQGAAYIDALEDFVKRTSENWKHNADQISDAERDAVESKLDKATENMSVPSLLRLLRSQRDGGIIDEQAFNDKLAYTNSRLIDKQQKMLNEKEASVKTGKFDLDAKEIWQLEMEFLAEERSLLTKAR